MPILLISYLNWHYVIAPRQILGLLKNYAIGTWHLFFIDRHAKTLFSPWHRMRMRDVLRPHNLYERAGNVVVDAYTRILAALIRLVIILSGLCFEIVISVFFVALFFAWLLWPMVFVLTVSKGVLLILN